MESILKSIRAYSIIGLLGLSTVFYACDSTEKKREKNKDAIPTEKFEEASRADSLSNNDVNSDNDGNDGTANGSMPENVTQPAPKKDN